MKILLLSHGGMAAGMYESISMICGCQSHIYHACLAEGEGIVDFEQRLNQLLDQLLTDQLIVLTDIRGGSPNTTCVNLLGKKGKLEQTPVIAGMNLPLLVSLALNTGAGMEVDYDKLLAEAKDAIYWFVPEQEEDEEL